ncbi:leucine-rich repeat domain-containing protein [Robertkochia sediminum]|uniref:leucine-rich repeat domain-containing protein n=1 Tax=Robertkochia sediminum TaxID=2785326 RepID=UPI001933F205|nr:leucine-rich repeat domain-containing protein [Robertkochia sediminum]MBL7472220.1 leucine-rich repeat domain-containing protein [Robertkochia sediminum]
MTKNISIHKAEFHKIFYTNSEENTDLLDDILSVETFIYPLEDKGNFYLYDLENEKLLLKHSSVSKFKLDKNIETLSFIGVPVSDVINLNIPNNTNSLKFEGGDLMPLQMERTKESKGVWEEVINLINLYKFIDSIKHRLSIEGELREIYRNKLPQCIADFGLSKLIEKLRNSNITDLTIGWTYFSDSDFKSLSEFKKLKSLSILYCYNDNLKWFPQNLTDLRIFGTTIQNLSEVNLNLKSLKTLDLSGNTISNLDGLSRLPNTLTELSLNYNLIKSFNIVELPENLEFLDLSNNILDNDFFNQNSVHENLKVLLLSNNQIVITSSILHSILERFPNIEYLELIGNMTAGVPKEYLGDEENRNCLAHVQFLLEEIDYKFNENDLELSVRHDLKDYVEIIWRQQLLPLKVILNDLQYIFSKYFIRMPSYKQFMNGLYCFVQHDTCEISIRVDEEKKEVLFRVQSDKSETVAEYFHKYFQEVNRIVAMNSHLKILPFINNSTSCQFLNQFYLKAFKIDLKVKSKRVLKLTQNNIEILINNRKIEEKENRIEVSSVIQGKIAGAKYEKIEDIAFILISGKSAYPFVIRNGAITNAITDHRDDYYYLILRTSLEKETYIEGITNKHLNDSSLKEVQLFIDNDIKKKISCFINDKYFHAKENILTGVNLESIKLREDFLKEIKMDNGKYCEFNIVEDTIELKYVY